MRTCPICGKRHVVMWPEFWPYRRGDAYYCSEQCLEVSVYRDLQLMNKVKKRKGKLEMGKLTLEIKKKAVDIAIGGGDPIEFLKRNGYEKAPDKMWGYIKSTLKEKDPDLYAKIPDRRTKKPEIPEQLPAVKPTGPIKIETPEGSLADEMAGMKDATDTFFRKCKDMGLNLDRAEEPDEPGEHFQTTAVFVSGLGEFYHDRKFKCVDWRNDEGDEVSLPPLGWMQLSKELPSILKRIGAIR